MGRTIPIYVKELRASMDWESSAWRNKFWTFMYLSVFPTLQRLDEEGRVPNITREKKVQIGRAIKKVLDGVEQDFGRVSMTHVVGCVSKLMERSLGPLHSDTVRKLVAEGFDVSEPAEVIVYGEK